MSSTPLHPPTSTPTQAHQPGVTDPIWPATPPPGLDDAKYAKDYAGQLERQRHLHIVTADVTVATRAELREVLQRLTVTARHQMNKTPPPTGVRSYDAPVTSRRVTVTIGFGATLFTTVHGDDRFGLAARRPSCLKIMPHIDGDAKEFNSRRHATDLVILIASDDSYVNEYIFGLLYYGKVHPGISVRRVERGYARPDSREPSGFEDGVSNPKGCPFAKDTVRPASPGPDNEMHSFVYVTREDGEPDWCVGGTYLAYRKIGRHMANFFKLDADAQMRVFGVDRSTGLRPLTGPMPPDDAHAQKMNPHRDGLDLFGRHDLTRRMLRRPYFFSDGLSDSGEEVRGVHHLSFARNLSEQYEWPVLMWQMNPDFPVKGARRDALYEPQGGATNIGGGFYFIPPAAPEGQFIGSEMLT